jgi:hypothetical protein
MSAQDQVQAVEEKIASQGAPVADKAPDEPTTATPVAESTEEPVDAASTEGAEADTERKRPGVHNRINELTKARREAERKAEAVENEKEYWRQLALKNQTQYQPPVENAQKTLADFNFDQRAYDRYVIREEIAEELAQKDRETKAQAEKAKIQDREKSFHERIQKFEDAHPDIDFVKEVIEAPIAISDPMADFIKESDIGPEMGVYFKDHKTEAKAIFDMVPSQAYRALAKLEVKLSAASPAIPEQPVQITRAPPAPPRLNASSAGRSASEGVQAEIAAVRAKHHR